VLKQFAVTEYADRPNDRLSTGMKQRVGLARAVVHDPPVVILDEPTSGLDPVVTRAVEESIAAIAAAGRCVLLSTHMMSQAEDLCDAICLILRSRKVLEGSLREVKSSFGRRAVALRAEGGDAVLEDARLVAGVKPYGDYVEVLLAEAADAQELLRRLVESGARVTRFEQVEPSLHDIFLQKVGESA
jgi:ABC-2 type transport system ATP-binding protein